MRRQALRLAGRPDNTPWIVETHNHRRTTQVDFVFALDYLSPNSRLMRLFADAMSPYSLSALLVNATNIAKVRREIETGWIHPYLYLDLSSRVGDEFEQTLYAAAQRGIATFRRPEQTRWVLKSQSQGALEAAGLPLPPTVVIPRSSPDRELTPEERAKVGECCVIKPSAGEAGKGVVAGTSPTAEAIAAARNFNRQDDWLVQSMVRWVDWDGRPAYVRAYNVCGQRTLLWWSRDSRSPGYAPLTWKQFHRYGLADAVQLLDRLAEVTGMDFFSTEIAVVRDRGPDRLCLIDYVNDQCDMDPAAHPEYSPPEPFCAWVCRTIAQHVWRIKTGQRPPVEQSLVLWP